MGLVCGNLDDTQNSILREEIICFLVSLYLTTYFPQMGSQPYVLEHREAVRAGAGAGAGTGFRGQSWIPGWGRGWGRGRGWGPDRNMDTAFKGDKRNKLSFPTALGQLLVGFQEAVLT